MVSSFISILSVVIFGSLLKFPTAPATGTFNEEGGRDHPGQAGVDQAVCFSAIPVCLLAMGRTWTRFRQIGPIAAGAFFKRRRSEWAERGPMGLDICRSTCRLWILPGAIRGQFDRF